MIVTPKKCGLYETTRDLAHALRKNGVDARLVDPTYETNQHHPKTEEDRGVPLEKDLKWAETADYLVNHSGMGKVMCRWDKPCIQVAHGRPYSSFLLEENDSTAVYSYLYTQNRDHRVKAMVTFWPEHVPYWQAIMPDKPVYHIPSMCDLDAWTPEGPAHYNWSGLSGKINVLITDPCRLDLSPYTAINCFILWARKQSGAKLHIFGKDYQGLKGWKVLLQILNEEGHLGETRGWVNSGLDNLYRAANMVITSNEIDTRTRREGMACGCPVVKIADIEKDQDKMTLALNADRGQIRLDAERMFNPANSAAAFIDMLSGVGA